MKKLPIILITVCTCLSVFALSLFQSCKPNSCSKMVCQNGGVCETGKCKCPSGYEGTFCEINKITRYYGIYKGTAKDNFGNVYNGWSVKIEPKSGVGEAINLHVYNSTGAEEISFGGKINAKGAFVLDSVRKDNRKYNNVSGQTNGSYLSMNYARSHGYGTHKPDYNAAIGLVYYFDFSMWK